MRIGAPRALLLLARYGSPLFVYDAALVRAAFLGFRDAFPYQPTELHYAIVCNKNPYLVRALHALGAGVHANTPGDAYAALKSGVPAARIVYSGSNLGAEDFDFLLKLGIGLNLDSLDQLSDLGAARARLGIAPGLACGLRLTVDDAPPGRLGVTQDELDDAVAIAARGGLRVTALHMYAGTNTLQLERFRACLERVAAAAPRLPDLQSLNVGGGFGVAYRESQAPLDVEALGRAAALALERLSARLGRRLTLLAEPGRTLVAEAGALLLRVVSVKQRGGRRYVGVDGTVANVAVESVYHARHRIESVTAAGPELDVPTDVCGNTTHSRDYLARGAHLPALAPGDVLSLRDVGAYGYAVSSHFLNRPRPAEVVLDGDESVLTTRRETLDDLLATAVV